MPEDGCVFCQDFLNLVGIQVIKPGELFLHPGKAVNDFLLPPEVKVGAKYLQGIPVPGHPHIGQVAVLLERGQHLDMINRYPLRFVDGRRPSVIQVGVQVRGEGNCPLVGAIQDDCHLLPVDLKDCPEGAVTDLQAIIVPGKEDPVPLRECPVMESHDFFPKIIRIDALGGNCIISPLDLPCRPHQPPGRLI